MPSALRRACPILNTQCSAALAAVLERCSYAGRDGGPAEAGDERQASRPAAMGSDLAPHQEREILAHADQCASETAASLGTFRCALERRRCLMHANAFYEWRTMPNGKQPYAIGRKDGAPLAFAGALGRLPRTGWRNRMQLRQPHEDRKRHDGDVARPDAGDLGRGALVGVAGRAGRGPIRPFRAARRWASAPLGGQPSG